MSREDNKVRETQKRSGRITSDLKIKNKKLKMLDLKRKWKQVNGCKEHSGDFKKKRKNSGERIGFNSHWTLDC